MTVTFREVRRCASSRCAITVEQALYVVAFAVGAAVRFGGLRVVPLSSLEAWSAWSAWQAASGLPGPSDLTPTSPLWHNLQAFLFWLGADGDGWARSISAASGAVLVLTPWMLRGLMGRPSALILSALIALDPWLIAFSRLADGAMLSATLAVLLLGGTILWLERYESEQARRPNPDAPHPGDGIHRGLGIVLASVAGLYVVSGHMAWGFAPVLLAFCVLNWRAIRQSLSVGSRLGWEAALWFGVSAIAGATAPWGLPAMVDGARPVGGIGLVSASLTMWLDSVLVAGAPVPASTMVGGYALGWPLMRLLVDQPLLALFGIGGLVLIRVKPGVPGMQQDAFATRIHWRLTLWLWLAWGGLLCLLPGRSPFSLLVLVFPLLFGAAYALGGLWAGAKMLPRNLETLILWLTLAILSISAAFWGIALVSETAFSSSAAQAVVVIVGLAVAIVILFGAWSNVRHAIRIAAMALSVVLVLASVSSAWQLNHRSRPERRDSFFREAGTQGVRQLTDDIATLSAHRAGNPYEIPVFVQSAQQVQSPPAAPEGLPPAFRTPGSSEDVLLGWYLRAMKRVTWGGLPQDRFAVQIAPLLVESYSGDPHTLPTPMQGYIGSDYVMRSAWLPDMLAKRDGALEQEGGSGGARLSRLWPTAIQPRLRWAFYRNTTVTPQEERAILWAEGEEAGEIGALPLNSD